MSRLLVFLLLVGLVCLPIEARHKTDKHKHKPKEKHHGHQGHHGHSPSAPDWDMPSPPPSPRPSPSPSPSASPLPHHPPTSVPSTPPPSGAPSSHSYRVYDVTSFGAKGDGVTDDVSAFQKAWNRACNERNAVLLVPSGKTFLVSHTSFEGSCASGMKFQLEGKLLAPLQSDGSWPGKSSGSWITFEDLDSFSFFGSGTVDGQGDSWWHCSKSNGQSCKSRPYGMSFKSVNDLAIDGIHFVNSPKMHLVISGCSGVTLKNLDVQAPGKSPNTDGIHITKSQNVVIADSVVATGDDCVSIVGGSANVALNNIVCGPGHGISIGSLGGDGKFDEVKNVVVTNSSLTGTTNGLRIKTYKNGKGSVSHVVYSHITLEDVENPIIITQEYCDKHHHDCSAVAQEPETACVHIQDVQYHDVHGTSKSPVSVTFDCSSLSKCSGIVMDNVSIQRSSSKKKKDKGKGVSSLCQNVIGTGLPSDCKSS